MFYAINVMILLFELFLKLYTCIRIVVISLYSQSNKIEFCVMQNMKGKFYIIISCFSNDDIHKFLKKFCFSL